MKARWSGQRTVMWIHCHCWIHAHLSGNLRHKIQTSTVEPHYNGSEGINNLNLFMVEFCYCQYIKQIKIDYIITVATKKVELSAIALHVTYKMTILIENECLLLESELKPCNLSASPTLWDFWFGNNDQLKTTSSFWKIQILKRINLLTRIGQSSYFFNPKIFGTFSLSLSQKRYWKSFTS